MLRSAVLLMAIVLLGGCMMMDMRGSTEPRHAQETLDKEAPRNDGKESVNSPSATQEAPRGHEPEMRNDSGMGPMAILGGVLMILMMVVML